MQLFRVGTREESVYCSHFRGYSLWPLANQTSDCSHIKYTQLIFQLTLWVSDAKVWSISWHTPGWELPVCRAGEGARAAMTSPVPVTPATYGVDSSWVASPMGQWEGVIGTPRAWSQGSLGSPPSPPVSNANIRGATLSSHQERTEIVVTGWVEN